MQQEWLLDVIADVKSFARQNDLPDLASHMETAWLLATAEIASLSEDGFGDERGAATKTGERATVG
ncbi:MAG: hypothetical protein AAF280_01975 [Pseudomonadota bacterium]